VYWFSEYGKNELHNYRSVIMLTDREKEIIRLREDEGLSWGRIAAALGTSKGSAHSSYRNAQYKLKYAALGSAETSKPVDTAEEEPRAILFACPNSGL
jgi:predicted DNA-binding protein (UPF0251 family)